MGWGSRLRGAVGRVVARVAERVESAAQAVLERVAPESSAPLSPGPPGPPPTPTVDPWAAFSDEIPDNLKAAPGELWQAPPVPQTAPPSSSMDESREDLKRFLRSRGASPEILAMIDELDFDGDYLAEVEIDEDYFTK